jgi:leucyl aminopeptidase
MIDIYQMKKGREIMSNFFDTPQKGFQFITQEDAVASIPLQAVTEDTFKETLDSLPAATSKWIQESGFKGKPRTICLIPDRESGTLASVLYGVSDTTHEKPWDGAFLARALPQEHTYHFEEIDDATLVSWMLAEYQFHHDGNQGQKIATLKVPKARSIDQAKAKADAISWVRSLVNCPANIATPEFLAQEAEKLAITYQGHFKEIVGPDLETTGYPLVWTVGQASENQPRFVEITWGNPKHFKLALVGKGVTFDTGGLNIKTGHYMDLMKKDMGGAAFAMGLARWIMATNLPIHLSLYLPLAENSIGQSAMRPGDIVKAGNGDTVEITDTDAEGRLILADAIHRATQNTPDLILDFATLTGAARVALGTEVPAFFTNDAGHQQMLLKHADETHAPLWPLPLWEGYNTALKSKVATLKNTETSPYGGAIKAALFLKHFVKEAPWIHVDLMAWNITDRPGRPHGGEAQSFEAFCAFLKNLTP